MFRQEYIIYFEHRNNGIETLVVYLLYAVGKFAVLLHFTTRPLDKVVFYLTNLVGASG